jgi:hypothetical protein
MQGVFSSYCFLFLEAEEFYRFDLRAEYVLWLEYGNGLPLRTHPAGPIGDWGILWQQKRWVASFGGKC